MTRCEGSSRVHHGKRALPEAMLGRLRLCLSYRLLVLSPLKLPNNHFKKIFLLKLLKLLFGKNIKIEVTKIRPWAQRCTVGVH